MGLPICMNKQSVKSIRENFPSACYSIKFKSKKTKKAKRKKKWTNKRTTRISCVGGRCRYSWAANTIFKAAHHHFDWIHASMNFLSMEIWRKDHFIHCIWTKIGLHRNDVLQMIWLLGILCQQFGIWFHAIKHMPINSPPQWLCSEPQNIFLIYFASLCPSLKINTHTHKMEWINLSGLRRAIWGLPYWIHSIDGIFYGWWNSLVLIWNFVYKIITLYQSAIYSRNSILASPKCSAYSFSAPRIHYLVNFGVKLLNTKTGLVLKFRFPYIGDTQCL